MPNIVLDQWIDLGVRGCNSITVTQRRTVPGHFEMQSPIAYWTMDEASGTRFDSFGLNNVDEATGPSTAVAGVINDASVPSVLQKLGSTGLWNYANGITMAGWFKFTGSPLSDPGNVGTCGFGMFGTGLGEIFRLAALADGNLYAESRVFSGLTSRALFSGVVFNAFMFIRMWVDPADNKVHCRINEGATQDGVDAMTPPFSISPLNIEFTQSPLATAIAVDEVGIYGSVLSDADAAFLYNSGSAQRPPLP